MKWLNAAQSNDVPVGVKMPAPVGTSVLSIESEGRVAIGWTTCTPVFGCSACRDGS